MMFKKHFSLLMLVVFLITLLIPIPRNFAQADSISVAYSDNSPGISGKITINRSNIEIGKVLKIKAVIYYNGRRVKGAEVQFIGTDSSGITFFEKEVYTNLSGTAKVNIQTNNLQPDSTYKVLVTVCVYDCFAIIGAKYFTTK